MPESPDRSTEKIPEDADRFLNRPVHKVLTSQVIDSTSENLGIVILDNLLEKITDYSKEYEIVTSLSKGRVAFYIVWMLDAEINNGGFNQYFFNSSGKFAWLAVDALRLIGAPETADIMSRANEIYSTEKERLKGIQNGTMEGFMKSYEENPLNDLDREYYALSDKEPLLHMLEDYVRNHKDEFVDA